MFPTVQPWKKAIKFLLQRPHQIATKLLIGDMDREIIILYTKLVTMVTKGNKRKQVGQRNNNTDLGCKNPGKGWGVGRTCL